MSIPRSKSSPARSAATLRLRILATTDLHSQLLAWNYQADAPADDRGFARTSSLIAAARQEQPNCLLFDNGDFLQGSPIAELAADGGLGAGAAVHPMIAAMNLMGYDAAALGNHEFSHGFALLDQALRDARFPVLSATLARVSDAATTMGDEAACTFLPPVAMLERTFADEAGQSHVLRIGVIGLTPPQVLIWDSLAIGARLVARPILEAAAVHVPALRAAGADLVVALSHSGLGSGLPEGNGTENVSALLAAMDGIDAVVAGHSHLPFPPPGTSGRIAGRPVVLPGFHGSHLGVIDLRLRRRDGRWSVQGARAGLRPIARRLASGRLVACVGDHPGVVAAVDAAHLATRAEACRPIGTLPQRLHSYFALVEDCPALHLVAEAQAAHVRVRLAGRAEARLPLLSAVAPFRAGGRAGPDSYTDLPCGPVARRHADDLYVFPNQIAALRLTGAEVADWLELAARQFLVIRPGDQDAALLDPEFPSFNFETIYGLSWQIDLSRPARFDDRGLPVQGRTGRVTQIRLGGAPLDPQTEVILATNSYRLGGSGGFPVGGAGGAVLSGPARVRDLVIDAIAAARPAQPPFRPAWGFVPMPGTTVVFLSSPRAVSLAGETGGRITPIGPAAGGFHHFRLRL